MTKFDRSQFKGADLKNQKQHIDSVTEQTSYSGNTRPKYVSIEEGKNVFRIAPPHDSKNPSMEAKCTVWLSIMVDWKEKDSEETKKVLKRRPLLNAKVHGGQKKDLVEAYIDFVYNTTAEQYTDKKEHRKLMNPIFGWRGSNGKWNSGIKPQVGWVCYVWKNEKLGRLELNQTIVNRMNELSIDEDSDEPIGIDPFSDPDNGVNLIVVYDKSKDSTKKYAVNRGSKTSAVTDEMLEELSEQDSLAEMLRDQYDMTVFNQTLEGLQRFDAENEFGAFDHQDFLDICEELKTTIPEPKADEDEEDTTNDTNKTTTATDESTTTEAAAADEDTVALAKSIVEDLTDKDALVAFAEEWGIPVTILAKHSAERAKEDILDAIDEHGIVAPANIDQDTKTEEKPKAKPAAAKKAPVKSAGDVTDKVAEMRDRLKKKS